MWCKYSVLSLPVLGSESSPESGRDPCNERRQADGGGPRKVLLTAGETIPIAFEVLSGKWAGEDGGSASFALAADS